AAQRRPCRQYRGRWRDPGPRSRHAHPPHLWKLARFASRAGAARRCAPLAGRCEPGGGAPRVLSTDRARARAAPHPPRPHAATAAERRGPMMARYEIAQFLSQSGVLRVLLGMRARARVPWLPVLTYHRVAEPSAADGLYGG